MLTLFTAKHGGRAGTDASIIRCVAAPRHTERSVVVALPSLRPESFFTTYSKQKRGTFVIDHERPLLWVCMYIVLIIQVHLLPPRNLTVFFFTNTVTPRYCTTPSHIAQYPPTNPQQPLDAKRTASCYIPHPATSLGTRPPTLSNLLMQKGQLLVTDSSRIFSRNTVNYFPLFDNKPDTGYSGLQLCS